MGQPRDVCDDEVIRDGLEIFSNIYVNNNNNNNHNNNNKNNDDNNNKAQISRKVLARNE